MCKLNEILNAFTVTQWKPTHKRSTVIYYVETLGNNWHLKRKITSEKKRVVCPFWLSGGLLINVIIHLEDFIRILHPLQPFFCTIPSHNNGPFCTLFCSGTIFDSSGLIVSICIFPIFTYCPYSQLLDKSYCSYKRSYKWLIFLATPTFSDT